MKRQQEVFSWNEYTCIITGGRLPEVLKDKKKASEYMAEWYQRKKITSKKNKNETTDRRTNNRSGTRYISK